MDVTIPLDPVHGQLEVAEYLGILWPDLPRRAILELFRLGRVRSGGRPVGQRRRTGELGDLLLVGGLDSVPRIFRGALDRSPGASGVALLYEDERLLVFAKPPGVPVVPDRDKAEGSLLGVAITRELERRASGGDPASFRRPRVVHRIDRWTSGVVILAQTAAAERQLGADFEERRITKRYLALLTGQVGPGRISVHCPVVEGRKGRMRAELLAPGPLGEAEGSAFTRFDVLERRAGSGETLVEASPKSGRTHQIRVHAWALGHPVVGDPVYGVGAGKRRRPGCGVPAAAPELRLHAWRYELPAEWEEPRVFVCDPESVFLPGGEAGSLPDPGRGATLLPGSTPASGG